MFALGTQRGQRIWAAVNGVATVSLAGADWLGRAWGGGSFMAPTLGLLWLSIALGGALGAAGLTAAWLMPQAQREFTAEFGRLPLRERLLWRYQRRNLLYHGWFLLLLLGLIGWCWHSAVFVLPAIFAANAVLFTALPAWMVPSVAAEPERPAEPDAAADRPRD
jgi:hypothetical protein